LATDSDYFAVAYEESPRYENAPDSGTTQLSTVRHDFAAVNATLNPGTVFEDLSDEIGLGEETPEGFVSTYEPAGGFEMRIRPTDMLFLLPGMCLVGSSQVGDGSYTEDPDGEIYPASARLWTFEKLAGTDVAKTFQAAVGYKNSGRFLRVQGATIPSATLTATTGRISADMIGMVFSRIVDPNFTVTPNDETPLLLSNFRMTGLEAVVTPTEATFVFGAPADRYRGLDTESYFATTMYRGDERMTLTGDITVRAMTTAGVDSGITGEVYPVLARWRSPDVIAGSTRRAVWVEGNAQIQNVEQDPISSARAHGGTLNYKMVDDGSGVDYRVHVMVPAATNTYETFAP
jgi:hypothetical protein